MTPDPTARLAEVALAVSARLAHDVTAAVTARLAETLAASGDADRERLARTLGAELRAGLEAGLGDVARELRAAGERQAAGAASGMSGMAAGLSAAVTETVRASFTRIREELREQDASLGREVLAEALRNGLERVTIQQAAQEPPTVHNAVTVDPPAVTVDTGALAGTVERLVAALPAALAAVPAPTVEARPGEVTVRVEIDGAALGQTLGAEIGAALTAPRTKVVTHRYDADGRLAASRIVEG